MLKSRTSVTSDLTKRLAASLALSNCFGLKPYFGNLLWKGCCIALWESPVAPSLERSLEGSGILRPLRCFFSGLLSFSVLFSHSDLLSRSWQGCGSRTAGVFDPLPRRTLRVLWETFSSIFCHLQMSYLRLGTQGFRFEPVVWRWIQPVPT